MLFDKSKYRRSSSGLKMCGQISVSLLLLRRRKAIFGVNSKASQSIQDMLLLERSRFSSFKNPTNVRFVMSKMLLAERLKECNFKTFQIPKVSGFIELNLFPEKSSCSISVSNFSSLAVLIPSIFRSLHVATVLFEQLHKRGHCIFSAFIWCTTKCKNTNTITINIIPKYDSNHLCTDDASLLRSVCHPLYYNLRATHFAVR